MNIKDLENFYNISSFKSFSFASKMLGVTQPTLSESIKRLENQLGATLFYRSKKGITLTPVGEQTLEHVKDLLNIKNEIISITSEQSDISKNYSIGCHPIVGKYFLTSFLSSIHKTYSNVNIDLVHDNSREIQKQIQDGKVDIGVVVNPVSNPDLIIKKLCYDKICIWQSSKIKIKKDQFIADLGLTQVQSILRSWKSAPSRHISSQDFQLIGEMTEAGLGFGILPERFVKQEKLKLRQVYTSIDFKDELSLVYRPEFGKSEVEKFITSTIKSTFL
jgi:DNA-binding transcriptional LysR family regulator